ncbi:hypothetical protein WJX73_003940 [Symbiochloris irregularis]|uniref:AFG1-like ATPase n=1 Tax=Symbiochloris irregularis TaxID=706552 RepID=A0AAW1PIA3_9CHLO
MGHAIATARQRQQYLDRELGQPPPAPTAPKGLLIWGSVGSGKSLLMQLFYDMVEHAKLVPLRRRMHFNAAMLEVHARLHADARERVRAEDAAVAAHAVQAAASQLQAADSDNAQQDPVMAKQKAITRARLAVRRLLSGARRKKVMEESTETERFAQANAASFRKVAIALMYGKDATSSSDMSVINGSAMSHDERAFEAGVLCFDEVQVTDPFAAVALKGILEALLEMGVIIVATANRAPWDWNRQGIHEDLFQHFVVGKLLEAADVIEVSCEHDYRRALSHSHQAGAGFFYPISPESQLALESQWEEATAHGKPQPRDVPVLFGRWLQVRSAVDGVARFSFEELCAQPLGAADYLALCQSYHTVFITGIPAMSVQVKDQARRFITLVDELYNARVRLVCTAACAPDALFTGAEAAAGEEAILDLESLQFETAVQGSRLRRDLLQEGGVAPIADSANQAVNLAGQLGGLEERFAFRRAVSRLHEMQSTAYLASRKRH